MAGAGPPSGLDGPYYSLIEPSSVTTYEGVYVVSFALDPAEPTYYQPSGTLRAADGTLIATTVPVGAPRAGAGKPPGEDK